MAVKQVILVFLLCLSSILKAEVPSTCLTQLTTARSPLCCRTQPFLEISFALKFGCSVPEFLDQGIRLELRRPTGAWQSIRYYAAGLQTRDGSIVNYAEQGDNTKVSAVAFSYTSDFNIEVVDGNVTVEFREYVCNTSYLVDGLDIRWMQRYSGESEEDVATWSLDDVTITVWNGQCRTVVFSENFEDDKILHDSQHDVRAANVSALQCESSGGNKLYFRQEASQRETARRSLTLSNLTLSSNDECEIPTMDAGGVCEASGCGLGSDVCSIGSLQCTDCYVDGYLTPPGDTVGACVDIDECETSSMNNCQQLCTNTDGSYQCACRDGYSLASDGANCEDIDECEVQSSACQQQCTNTAGSFQCSCGDGYSLASDGVNCEDIDECETSSMNDCQQLCTNTDGSYQCACGDGYSLASDGANCEDIDECASSNGDCQQLCTNTGGSFQCGCRDGYSLASDGFNCEDVNECDAPTCAQVCNNTAGSFVCSCFLGYVIASDGVNCEDVDECETSSMNDCQQLCTNTDGSYQCTCRDGYSLASDTFNCEDVNECANVSMNICNGLCANTDGSFQCGCGDGYSLASDGVNCEDIDECAISNGDCQQLCTNTAGSFQCGCRDGYSLASDGFNCEDIDECETSSLIICQQLCTNTDGSFQCGCRDGYSLASDGFSCEDIDECEDSMNACQQLCTNTDGSYQCACRDLYSLASDGVSCDRLDAITFERSFEQLLDFQRTLSQSGQSSGKAALFLKNLISDLIKAGTPAPRNLSVLLASSVDGLLSSIDTGGEETEGEQEAVSSVLGSLDKFALKVYDNVEPELETTGFRLRVKSVNDDSSERVEGINSEGNKITLPSLGNGVKVASFFFKDLSRALPANPNMDSDAVQTLPVISSSVSCDNCDVTNLTDPVRYQINVGKLSIIVPVSQFTPSLSVGDCFQMFMVYSGLLVGFNQHLTMGLANVIPVCYFYDLSKSMWSTDGCSYNKSLSNSTLAVCECNHLTHFAILLSPGLNISDTIPLQTIGYVGVGISLLFLLLTIFSLTFIKSLWGMRNFIHINLCVSLFISQLIFVTAVDKTHNLELCQAIAIVLQYFFLVTFMWMLMEGVVLYVALVKVFVKKQKLYMAGFFVVSYGLPALYLCLTVPLGLLLSGDDGNPHYGYSEACWLRTDTGFIWAFIAPVVVIIFINIGFFIMALCIMRKHSKRQIQKSRVKNLTHWLKSSITLMFIMGIPWIIGIVIFDEALEFLAYIYTIFIAFQGLALFILFVPVSKQVRESYRKWWRGKVSESDFLSKHFSSSDMDKNTSFLGRFSSLRTSTFRMSRFERSTGTFKSSHADDTDIKLPTSPKDRESMSPSMSPPPTLEKYVIESKATVTVLNGTANTDTNDTHPDTTKQNGFHSVENGLPSADRRSMTEERKIDFNDEDDKSEDLTVL